MDQSGLKQNELDQNKPNGLKQYKRDRNRLNWTETDQNKPN